MLSFLLRMITCEKIPKCHLCFCKRCCTKQLCSNNVRLRLYCQYKSMLLANLTGNEINKRISSTALLFQRTHCQMDICISPEPPHRCLCARSTALAPGQAPRGSRGVSGPAPLLRLARSANTLLPSTECHWGEGCSRAGGREGWDTAERCPLHVSIQAAQRGGR